MQWGICTTLKSTPEQALAFVAHHLSIGATHIWLNFDDPDDPAATLFEERPDVTATLCSDSYWNDLIGRRPAKHQNRQARNAQRVYALGAVPWLAHIDVDEFLLPQRDISHVLAEVAPDKPVLRVAPWEALHNPALPDDIFTAQQFRAALRGPDNAAARARVFGEHAEILPFGVFSHAAGKCFFRTGLSRFEPRLHGAFRAGVRVAGGDFTPDIALLHFHAEDPARWHDRLQFRLTRGAYQFNPPLQHWLQAASPAQIEQFYHHTQVATPETLARLRGEGILLETDLALRTKIAAWNSAK